MKYFISLFMAIGLTACGTTSDADHSCLRRVAAAEVAVTESYQSTGDLLRAGYLKAPTAKKALQYTDSANAAVDSAAKFCAIDEPKAWDYLEQATNLLVAANKLRGGA